MFSFVLPVLTEFIFFAENTLRTLIRGIVGGVTPESIVKTLIEFSLDVTADKVSFLFFLLLFLFFLFHSFS